MALPEPEEPRSWPAAITTTIVVLLVLGLLVVMLVGGWHSLEQHMNERINLRPTPSVAGTR